MRAAEQRRREVQPGRRDGRGQRRRLHVPHAHRLRRLAPHLQHRRQRPDRGYRRRTAAGEPAVPVEVHGLRRSISVPPGG